MHAGEDRCKDNTQTDPDACTVFSARLLSHTRMGIHFGIGQSHRLKHFHIKVKTLVSFHHKIPIQGIDNNLGFLRFIPQG